MNTQTCRATISDPAFVSSSFGNAEDQAIYKPVHVAPIVAGFDARVSALFRPYYAAAEDWVPTSLGAYFSVNLAYLRENASQNHMGEADSPQRFCEAF